MFTGVANEVCLLFIAVSDVVYYVFAIFRHLSDDL